MGTPYNFSLNASDEEKIIFLHTRQVSQRKIKEYLHIGSDKVSRVIRHYKSTGEILKPNREKYKLTPEILAHIHQKIYGDAHITLNQLQKSISEKFEMAIAISTIAEGCKMLRYKYKPPKHRQLLTPKQKSDRVSFAYSMINMYYEDEIDLLNIVFSDESRFVLGDDKRWVWRRNGEYNPTSFVQTGKFAQSLMIYGAIGFNYKSKLVFIDDTVDSKKYQENVIKSEMFEDMNGYKGRGQWIFMQDGARCHTSNDTKLWLGSKCSFIDKWPANSPDLNPIENLWGCMKKAVSLINPQSKEDLKAIIQEVWDNIEIETINSLVQSFYQRLQLVMIENGNSIQNHLRKGLSNLNICLTEPPEDVEIVDNLIHYVDEENEIEIPVVSHNDGPFREDEDKIIIQKFLTFGTQWGKISKYLNRTPVQIKNRFNTHLKKVMLTKTFSI